MRSALLPARYPKTGDSSLLSVRIFTVGHGTRPVEELVAALLGAGVETLVDVRRFPGSRRNPQFDQAALSESLSEAGIDYRHAVELGGRRSGEPGAERFNCIETAGFRSYVARMGAREWQRALDDVLALPAPCLMCAETLWWRCHRRLISDLLVARRHEVVHLIRPHEIRAHRLPEYAAARDGRLYVCGELVA
jgi:uncharacterized protein (DUF488 family)